MDDTLDVISSSLASSLRLWRGTNAHPAAVQPAKVLQLYDIEACPYCRLVREALTELDLDALIFPCPKDGRRYRPRARKRGCQSLFPYLVDRNTRTALYESADIIAYLYREYGQRHPPSRLMRMLDVSSSMSASAMRGRAGFRVRKSIRPAQPLMLFSFEASPYSRRVRELLCELEIAYLPRNTGKAVWQDLGPPRLRKALFPELPVEGRCRRELLERAGRVQLPYLVDPNTGSEMFESEDICRYLLENYARA